MAYPNDFLAERQNSEALRYRETAVVAAAAVAEKVAEELKDLERNADDVLVARISAEFRR